MVDKNYEKYADYLDPNSDEPKLVKNAPESAKKAFAQWKKAEEATINPNQAMADYLKKMDRRNKK